MAPLMGLGTRAASVSTGPTGWAEPWNRLGDWQASSESSRARKSSNLMTCYLHQLKSPNGGASAAPRLWRRGRAKRLSPLSACVVRPRASRGKKGLLHRYVVPGAKDRGPLQAVPVMARAMAERLGYIVPCQSKPLGATVTVWRWP